ncbi:hypothetical protein L3Q82_005930 [Scortum barcoo]|uniref:Uncharacterized protein n=1 Tax=Scortum barcoo TaxID=214431 RepID=A0ACB8X215_9TELE|nr:hypothetical protein L3Q82_005930 [Scortum barcoo]
MMFVAMLSGSFFSQNIYTNQTSDGQKLTSISQPLQRTMGAVLGKEGLLEELQANRCLTIKERGLVVKAMCHDPKTAENFYVALADKDETFKIRKLRLKAMQHSNTAVEDNEDSDSEEQVLKAMNPAGQGQKLKTVSLSSSSSTGDEAEPPYDDHESEVSTLEDFALQEDAICSALHLSLTHLEEKMNMHVMFLFLDFSSAFNTIIPQHLVGKLGLLAFSTPLCNWLLDFLTERPQSVRVSKNTSSVITLSTGSPQGCVLSPLLFTLMTHDCVPRSATNHTGGPHQRDDLAYREEVEQLVRWCEGNNLILNVDVKTKEIIVDFRKIQPSHAPLLINNSAVEVVSSTRFLGVHITDDLTWSVNSAVSG